MKSAASRASISRGHWGPGRAPHMMNTPILSFCRFLPTKLPPLAVVGRSSSPKSVQGISPHPRLAVRASSGAARGDLSSDWLLRRIPVYDDSMENVDKVNWNTAEFDLSWIQLDCFLSKFAFRCSWIEISEWSWVQRKTLGPLSLLTNLNSKCYFIPRMLIWSDFPLEKQDKSTDNLEVLDLVLSFTIDWTGLFRTCSSWNQLQILCRVR